MARKYKVLLLENSKFERILFNFMVRQNHLEYEYTIAESIAEAKNILAQKNFDLIISEHLLKDGNASDIFELQTNLPIIIIPTADKEKIAINPMKTGDYNDLTEDYVRNLPIAVENAIEHQQTEEQRKLLSNKRMNIGDSIYITDREDNIIFANQIFEQTYEYELAEIIGKKSSVLWSQNSDGEAMKNISDLTSEENGEGEFYHQTKNGDRFPVFISCSVLKEHGNKVNVFVVNDLTSHKKSENQIQELNETLKRRTIELSAINKKLEAEIRAHHKTESALQQALEEIWDLYNNAPCGYHSLDSNATLIAINDTLLEWLDYTREEVIEKLKFPDLLAPEYLPKFEQYFQNLKKQIKVQEIEFQMVCKNGKLLPILLSATALYDREGNFVKSHTTVFDITERKRAEMEIRNTKNFLDAIVENLPIGIFAKDAKELRWVLWNKFFTNLTGYSKTETIGKSDRDFFPTEQADFFHAKDREVLSEKRLVDITEEKISTRHNGVRLLHTIKVPILNEYNHPEYLLGISEDITERKQFEATLQRRDAILEAVAYTAEQFLKAPNWQHGVNQVLEQLGCATQASRAYIFQNHLSSNKTLLASQYSEWVAPGIEPRISNPILQNIDLYHYSNEFVNKLSQGETCCGIIKNLNNRFLQKILNSFNIISIAIVPIFVNDKWWGFIGFDDCCNERKWSSVEIDALQAAANVLGAAIARQQSEEALRTSEERFRNLVETTTDLVWEVDENALCTYVSPKVRDVLGYEPEEMLGKTPFDFMTVKDATRSEDIFASIIAIAAHSPFKFLEAKQKHKAGFEIFLETSGVPIFSPDGNFRGYRGIARDITHRKYIDEILRQRGEALRVSQERLELATVAGNVGVWDWNIQTNEIYIDSILKIQLGYNEYELRNNIDTWYSLIHPDDRKKVFAAIDAHLNGLTYQYEIEYRRLHKDGSIRWFISRGTAIWDQNNKPYRMAGADTDITQRKQTEEELQRLSLQNELILNSAGDGIIGLDTQGNITFINPAAAKMTGYEVPELIAQPLQEHLRHSKQDGIAYNADNSPIYAVLKDGIARNLTDELFWRKDGSNFLVEYVITPIVEGIEKPNLEQNSAIDSNNNPSNSSAILPCSAIKGAVVTFRDISERRVVERMKDEFISVVSHELRTPLTSIRGSLGLLFSGKLGELSEKGHRMIEIAVNNTDRLVRLINDILDLERMESGKIQMDRQMCHPLDLLTAAVEVMQGMADKSGVNLLIVGQSKSTLLLAQDDTSDLKALPLLYADSDRLTQVLTNLLSNAIKFSVAGATIFLTAEVLESIEKQHLPSWENNQVSNFSPLPNFSSPGQHLSQPHFPTAAPISQQILFKVKDQGRGIPADKLETIFGRFQQVDASDSRSKGGTGLGLAICRSIVDLHGGKIWVESTVGEGSIFYFTIPVTQE